MGVYVDLPAVKDLLFTHYKLRVGGRRIDFSEMYRDLRKGANNTGSVVLSQVVMDDSFAGSVEFKIEFTSATAFTAYFKPDGQTLFVSIGSGVVGSTFTATYNSENLFSILSTYWSGTAVAGDTILWRTESIIS